MILHVSKPMISVYSDFTAMLLSSLILLACDPISLLSFLLSQHKPSQVCVDWLPGGLEILM